MVQYSNECFLTGEQISSERGILIRSETRWLQILLY